MRQGPRRRRRTGLVNYLLGRNFTTLFIGVQKNNCRGKVPSDMVQQANKIVEWVMENSEFDEVWYRQTFRDVMKLEAELNLKPIEHYLRYGVLMGRPPNATWAADPELFAAMTLPSPKDSEELLAAYEISRTGAHERAIHYARRYLPPKYAHAVHLLIANQALAKKDQIAWLSHINKYLEHFGVSTLQIGEGQSLMERLSSKSSANIHDSQLVSVLMPVWNAERTIGYAIRSILSQTWRNIELLVVDDASHDGSWKIIQQLAKSDNRIRAFRNANNVGPYVSKNIALSQSRGDWITGHDADDWAHPERLERQVQFCREINSAACMSGMLRMAEDGRLVRINKASGFFYDGACRSAFVSLMVHAQFLHDRLGFWDSVRVGGDSEFLRRIEHLIGKAVPDLKLVTMLCLDNPEGLTNHSELGHSEAVGISPHRRRYRVNYTKMHSSIEKFDSALSFPQERRRFPAPIEMLNPVRQVKELVDDYENQGVFVDRTIKSDITLITDLRFPGGNASSSIDEVNFFESQGFSVSVIHCPINGHFGKPISERFIPWKKKITNWSRVRRIISDVVICRHPVVALSYAFSKLAPRISAAEAFVVVNNSYLRENGATVYQRDALLQLSKKMSVGNLTFCPISPEIRNELQEAATAADKKVNFSLLDWTPTFNPAHYYKSPRSKMVPPFRVGRHGRDAPEKWRENAEQLLQAHPESSDFINVILGGASNAARTLGSLPKNWVVYDFGEIEPSDYLYSLDAFIYFPHSARIEAFGRTVVEAMFAGVPVILPRNFRSTFDDLPIYAEPSQVESIVRALAVNDEDRIAYLSEVQKIAVARYSSIAIARRMAGTKLELPWVAEYVPPLSSRSLAFKCMLENIGGGPGSK